MQIESFENIVDNAGTYLGESPAKLLTGYQNDKNVNQSGLTQVSPSLSFKEELLCTT